MPACLDKTCRLEKLDVCELAGRKKRRKRKRCRHCGVSMPMENSRQKLTLYSNSGLSLLNEKQSNNKAIFLKNIFFFI